MHLFEYKEIGPEILRSCQSRTEEPIVANEKTEKVKNVELLHIKETNTSCHR